MTVLTLIRQTSRAAVVAIALAGTALSVVPAEAAPNLNGFSLDVKPQGSPKELQQFKKQKDYAPNDFFNWCLTDKQIRKGLKAYGFFDVEIVNHLSKNRVRVQAGYDDWYYSMRIHRCSGVVDRIKKLYPVYDDEDWGDDDEWTPY
ncbi:hypothetical protein PRN20_20150 [Devosia sp. ZB163]|uniref:hypothetical protein n=1 Tax=Devosia sp. ZB163 TaxID=3025938 RepID=UPI002361061E|nr:hypothetical protein [Devosia sp. ZB163]MDC9826055.1 hypothetical protein [Devosia sp. ZB163]